MTFNDSNKGTTVRNRRKRKRVPRFVDGGADERERADFCRLTFAEKRDRLNEYFDRWLDAGDEPCLTKSQRSILVKYLAARSKLVVDRMSKREFKESVVADSRVLTCLVADVADWKTLQTALKNYDVELARESLAYARETVRVWREDLEILGVSTEGRSAKLTDVERKLTDAAEIWA